MIPPGGAPSLSSNSSDQLAATSGNVSGNTSSSDRITKQFYNIAGGSAAFDLNTFFANGNSAFASAVSSTNKTPQSNVVKYVAIGAGALVLVVGFIAWSKK